MTNQSDRPCTSIEINVSEARLVVERTRAVLAGALSELEVLAKRMAQVGEARIGGREPYVTLAWLVEVYAEDARRVGAAPPHRTTILRRVNRANLRGVLFGGQKHILRDDLWKLGSPFT